MGMRTVKVYGYVDCVAHSSLAETRQGVPSLFLLDFLTGLLVAVFSEKSFIVNRLVHRRFFSTKTVI